ncbi:MAG: hypothetical protein C0600_04715 [Ignavibacteria bacterium]|nr:MAG: hypothetical protein C0600_04715 [Ignavibacteria bacterium]
MKEQQRNEIKVGLTVVTGLIIILVGFSYFKDWSVGRSEYSIRMHFPTSAGLDVGDKVSVNGVRAGKVLSVDLRNGGVDVEAVISSDVEVKEHAIPVIQMLELMGGKKIDIVQGADGAPLPAGVVLEGRVDPDVAGALGLLGDMQGNVKDIGVQADSLLRSINAIVGDQQFISSLKETVNNLHAVSSELRGYMGRNGANIEKLTVNVVSLTGRMDTLLAELQPAVSGSLEKSDAVLSGADSLITEVRTLVREVRDSRGLLHTALHDTTLVHRLDRMLVKLDTLSSILIEGEFTTNIDLF